MRLLYNPLNVGELHQEDGRNLWQIRLRKEFRIHHFLHHQEYSQTDVAKKADHQLAQLKRTLASK